ERALQPAARQRPDPRGHPPVRFTRPGRAVGGGPVRILSGWGARREGVRGRAHRGGAGSTEAFPGFWGGRLSFWLRISCLSVMCSVPSTVSQADFSLLLGGFVPRSGWIFQDYRRLLMANSLLSCRALRGPCV